MGMSGETGTLGEYSIPRRSSSVNGCPSACPHAQSPLLTLPHPSCTHMLIVLIGLIGLLFRVAAARVTIHPPLHRLQRAAYPPALLHHHPGQRAPRRRCQWRLPRRAARPVSERTAGAGVWHSVQHRTGGPTPAGARQGSSAYTRVGVGCGQSSNRGQVEAVPWARRAVGMRGPGPPPRARTSPPPACTSPPHAPHTGRAVFMPHFVHGSINRWSLGREPPSTRSNTT